MPASTPLCRWLPIAAAAAVLLALGGCGTAPVQPDPTQVKLNDLDQRVGRIERVVNNESLVQLSQRIDQLDMQLRELRGEVEELQNNDDTLSKQQRDFYTDLDKRVAAVEAAQKGLTAAPAGGGSAGALTGAPATAPAGDQAAYESAFDTLKSAHYAEAVSQFSAFLQHYPNSSLADNAQYWLGESYYVTRDYQDAAAAFRAVGERYPNSRKAPDALLKLGYTQFDQQKLADARTTLTQVVQRYPNNPVAKLATEQLAKIPAGDSAGKAGTGPDATPPPPPPDPTPSPSPSAAPPGGADTLPAAQ